MLAKLMAQHRGVEPIKRQLAPIDHFDQAFQHFGFLAHLVTKTKLLIPLHEAQRLGRRLRLGGLLLLLHRSILLQVPLRAPLTRRRSNPTTSAALFNSSAQFPRHITFNPIKSLALSIWVALASSKACQWLRFQSPFNFGLTINCSISSEYANPQYRSMLR